MTQPQLCNASTLNINTIYRIETCQGNPGFTTIQLLAKAFGIEPLELVKPGSKAEMLYLAQHPEK